MRRLALSILFVASTASADRSRLDPVGASETESLKGNVLVWHDAALLVAPADTAQSIHLAVLESRRDHLGHVLPMRVVSVKGAFVEVEPVETECTWSRLVVPDDLSKLKLWVRRADLAPVLAKPFAKQLPDGTGVTLRPGVPVLPTTDGAAAVALGGDELVAEIPAASIAYSYVPDKSRAVNVSAHEYSIDAKTPGMLGDQAVAIHRRATGVERRGEAAIIAFDDRCSLVTLAIAGKAVREVEDDDTSTGPGAASCGGNLDLRGDDYLPKQTALMAGGRQVATAAKSIYPPIGSTPGKNVCVSRRLRLETSILPPNTTDVDDSLRLCAPRTKLAHDKVRAARR